MGIQTSCLSYGVEGGYGRVSLLTLRYLQDGTKTVEVLLDYYLSKEIRDLNLNPFLTISLSIPMEAFNGSFLAGGEYSDPDPRETVYNLLMDTKRNLFDKEIELSLDFRSGVKV